MCAFEEEAEALQRVCVTESDLEEGGGVQRVGERDHVCRVGVEAGLDGGGLHLGGFRTLTLQYEDLLSKLRHNKSRK